VFNGRPTSLGPYWPLWICPLSGLSPTVAFLCTPPRLRSTRRLLCRWGWVRRQADYHGDQDSRSATPQGRRHPGEADRQPILSSVRRGGRSTHDPGRENSSAWRILGRSLFIGGMAPLYPQPKESISMGRLTEAFDYTNLAVQAVCVRQGVYLARSQRSSLRVGLNDNRWENKCVTNLSHLRCWRSPACVADAHSP